jgi:hypothetical protein
MIADATADCPAIEIRTVGLFACEFQIVDAMRQLNSTTTKAHSFEASVDPAHAVDVA